MKRFTTTNSTTIIIVLIIFSSWGYPFLKLMVVSNSRHPRKEKRNDRIRCSCRCCWLFTDLFHQAATCRHIHCRCCCNFFLPRSLWGGFSPEMLMWLEDPDSRFLLFREAQRMAGAHRKSCNTGSKFLPEQCRPLQLQYLHYIACSLCIKKLQAKKFNFGLCHSVKRVRFA